MFLHRLLLLCGVSLLSLPALLAQNNPPPGSAEAAPAQPANAPERASTPARLAATPSGPQITFNSVYVDGPYIAMTFDDGPHGVLTPKLLDLLAARHIKATFFVVGQCVAEFPEILKRAAREGHEIANHSWSHPNLGKMSDDAVRSQLQKTDDAIKNAIGVRPTLMRPPYGSITARQKSWIHDEFGYRIIIWDVDPLDWKRPGPSIVTHRIVSETHPGSIILSHDIHAPTIEAMPATFEQLQEKGFKFVTVSELIAMAKPKPPSTPRPASSSPPKASSRTSSPDASAPAVAPAPSATTAPAEAPTPAPIDPNG